MKHSLVVDDEHVLPYIRDGTFPVIVAFSGGKDSIAMVLYLLEQGVDRRRIHLHRHEVDGGGSNVFDWPCTKPYYKAFADAMGLSLFFSYREGGIYREIFRNCESRQDIFYQREPGGPYFRILADKTAINTRLKFPAVSSNLLTRWCSSTVKIGVLLSVVAHHPLYQGRLVVLTGERRQESAARSKYLDVELYKAHTNTRMQSTGVQSWIGLNRLFGRSSPGGISSRIRHTCLVGTDVVARLVYLVIRISGQLLLLSIP
ncbi:MAG TPA: hypothetical protein VG605_15580 [Puia sp.]|nr:hypothetical protein [Puia sp.]